MEIYKDKNYPIEERAKDLLSKMTLDQKIDQIHAVGPSYVNELKDGNGEHEFGILFYYRKNQKKLIPQIQRRLLNEEPGIPLLIAGEGLHAFSYDNAVIFPQNIGMAGAFNEKVVEEIGKETGKAANSRGFKLLFAPDLDVAREPRWGRVQETYGEDPYLIGKMGSAYIRGLQSQGVGATLKHYIGYSMPENGINLSSVHIGEREIREVMLPQYEECLKEKPMAVMPAYNEIDGEPLHASKKWLQEVLREELGFDGLVISDWGGLLWLQCCHKIAEHDWEAGKAGIEAGVDVEAPDYVAYGDNFKEKVRSGEISEELVDEAVLRVLKLKFELGLFDGKALPPEHAPIRTKKAVRLARKAAEQAIALLKNDGILPLDISKKQKIALIGPNANLAQCGDYCASGTNKHLVSPLKAFTEKIGEENVLYADGCGFALPNEEELKKAVQTAKQADIVVLVLGDNNLPKEEDVGGTGGGGTTTKRAPVTDGEGYDDNTLLLPESQRELFEKVVAVGKPVITVLYTGKPRVIVNEYKKSAAFVQAWYPGEQGGYALADILYGDVNPSAKLAISLPQSDGHIPCHYNHHVSARGFLYKQPGSLENPGRDYVFASPDAFLPFGYGLSYTTYEYTNLKAKKTGDAEIEVKVTVQNTGNRDGEESVLVFVKHERAETVPFVKELKAFKRIALKAGQKKTVTFKLDASAFTIIGKDMKKKIAYGKQYVLVGNQKVEFTI